MVLEKSTEYKNDEKRYAGTIMIPGTYNFILLLPRERTRREQHFFYFRKAFGKIRGSNHGEIRHDNFLIMIIRLRALKVRKVYYVLYINIYLSLHHHHCYSFSVVTRNDDEISSIVLSDKRVCCKVQRLEAYLHHKDAVSLCVDLDCMSFQDACCYMKECYMKKMKNDIQNDLKIEKSRQMRYDRL